MSCCWWATCSRAALALLGWGCWGGQSTTTARLSCCSPTWFLDDHLSFLCLAFWPVGKTRKAGFVLKARLTSSGLQPWRSVLKPPGVGQCNLFRSLSHHKDDFAYSCLIISNQSKVPKLRANVRLLTLASCKPMWLFGSRSEQATFLMQQVIQGLWASCHIPFGWPTMPGDTWECIIYTEPWKYIKAVELVMSLHL